MIIIHEHKKLIPIADSIATNGTLRTAYKCGKIQRMNEGREEQFCELAARIQVSLSRAESQRNERQDKRKNR